LQVQSRGNHYTWTERRVYARDGTGQHFSARAGCS